MFRVYKLMAFASVIEELNTLNYDTFYKEYISGWEVLNENKLLIV